MDVAEQVVLRLHSALYSTEQLHTPGPHPSAAQVPMADRWCVGNKDVGVLRNRLPFLQTLSTSWQVECPVAKLWLPAENWKSVTLWKLWEFSYVLFYFFDVLIPLWYRRGHGLVIHQWPGRKHTITILQRCYKRQLKRNGVRGLGSPSIILFFPTMRQHVEGKEEYQPCIKTDFFCIYLCNITVWF